MRRGVQYRSLIVSLFIIIACIGMGLAFYANILVIRDYTNSIVEQSLKNQIRQNNDYIKLYLNSNIDIVKDVSKEVTLDRLNDKAALSADINKSLKKMNFEEAEFIDGKGFMYLENGTCTDVRDEDVFLESFNSKKVFISNAMGQEKVGYNLIGITVPVFINDNYYGCIYAVKDILNLKSRIKESFDYDNGFVDIIDQNGYVICNINNGYNQDGKIVNLYHFMGYGDVDLVKYSEVLEDDIKYNRSNIIEVDSNTGTGYFAYAPVNSSSNWVVVSYIKQSKISVIGKEMSDKIIEIISSITMFLIVVALYIFIVQISKYSEFKKIAYKDDLTGINNLLAFTDFAKKCIRKYKMYKYNIVVFDIKKFKYINYKYGYNYGDKVIKKIASALQKRYFDDEVCARLESDVFIILVKNNKGFEESLECYLKKQVLKNIDPVSFRFGIYMNVDEHQNITDVIDKAKFAWKYIKNTNKQSFSYYDDRLLQDIIDQEKLEGKMEKALQENEFKAYFQAKVDLTTDKICGAEALVRWISKDMGFMPPNKFIPLFEKNGFVIKIDFYMLEQVFEFLEELKRNNKPIITISVNQSRETIYSENYLKNIKNVVSKHDINPEYIELEITECVFVENHDKIIQITKALKDIGFKVSMDDFGAGYSSLNLLSEMPIDVLKIDRMFLDGTDKSEKNKIIIKSVIDMARNLGISVICEGVESDSQVDFLKRSNCKMAQGFFYSKPIPVNNFNELLDNNNS